MVTTDLPAGPLRSCPVRLGRAFSARVRRQDRFQGMRSAYKLVIVSPPRTDIGESTTTVYGETRATRAYRPGLNLPQSVAEHFCTGFKRDAINWM